jgi:hypothetical protein
MTELKVQRVVLWVVTLMGVASLPLGIIEPAFWWASSLGLVMCAGGICGARRVAREIRAERARRQTVLNETIFRQEIARTGRLDLARQAVRLSTARREAPVRRKESA